MFDPIVIVLGAVLFSMWLVAMFKDVVRWRVSIWRGYVWYTPKPLILSDTKMMIYPSILTHKTVLQEMENLKHQLAEANRQLADMVEKRKRVDNGQMSFLPVVSNNTNGTKPIISMDIGSCRYTLTFRNIIDKAKFNKPDQYVWVERITYHGKDNHQKRWYGWVTYPSSPDEFGDAYFDPTTDLPIISNIPPVWPNGKEKGELIPEKCLPFTWIEEKIVTPYSIKG